MGSEMDCAAQLSHMSERLHQAGCSAAIQVAAGGGGGGACLRNLRHTFLTYASRGARAAPLPATTCQALAPVPSATVQVAGCCSHQQSRAGYAICLRLCVGDLPHCCHLSRMHRT